MTYVYDKLEKMHEFALGQNVNKKVIKSHDLMWGKLSSILLPVFLKICSAASATFSSSIFRQPNKDSNVSAEWNDTGCVKDSTCLGKTRKKKFVFVKRYSRNLFHPK